MGFPVSCGATARRLAGEGHEGTKWFEAEEAATLVEEGGLAEIIKRFAGSYVRFMTPAKPYRCHDLALFGRWGQNAQHRRPVRGDAGFLQQIVLPSRFLASIRGLAGLGHADHCGESALAVGWSLISCGASPRSISGRGQPWRTPFPGAAYNFPLQLWHRVSPKPHRTSSRIATRYRRQVSHGPMDPDIQGAYWVTLVVLLQHRDLTRM